MAYFSFVQRPVLLSVQPSSGSRFQPMVVTVSGHAFSSNVLCKLGRVMSSSTLWVDEQTLLCSFDEVASCGLLPFMVGLNMEDFSNQDVAFSVRCDSGNGLLFPSNGPSSGGSVLKITNAAWASRGKTPRLTCVFSSVTSVTRSTATVLTTGDVVCTSPAHPVGLSDLTIVGGDDSTFSAFRFAFVNEAAVVHLLPHMSSLPGATVVTVVGEHFEG
eukprot:1440315-Rhodomonas_salina.1